MRWGVALAAALCVQPVTAAEWTLTDLLSARQAIVEARASFIQDRYSVLFDKPLRSAGHLHYRAPDFMLQEIAPPFASRKTLNGEILSVWRDGELVSVSLDHASRVGLYARALRGVLSGQIDDIGEHFRISLSGGEQAWVLRLTLREDSMQNDGRGDQPVSPPPYIEVHGQRERLRRIVLHESPAERTEMEIRKVR